MKKIFLIKIHERRSKMIENKLVRSVQELDKHEPKKIATKIFIIYITLGTSWVLLSDTILECLINEKEMITLISVIKGWIYVGVTGFMIYLLIYLNLKKIKDTQGQLIKSCQDVSLANQEIEAAYGQLTASEELLRQKYEEMIENQRLLKQSEARYRFISEATNDAIWEEKDNKFFFSNRWYEITGYNEKDLETIGNWEDLIHPEDRAAAKRIMEEHKNNKTPYYRCEYRIKTRNGNYKWIQARGKALFDERGKIYCMVGSHTDISKLKDYENRLHHLAYHDNLTGLKNRTALTQQLDELTKEGHSEKMALLFIDIDNFKYVNDTMGHTFGDIVLKKLAKKLAKLEDRDVSVYRLGGDEFVVLIHYFEAMYEVERRAVEILRKIKKGVEVEGSSIYNTASIGVSIFPQHGRNIDELLKNADIAVYKAKDAGKDKIIIYSESMDEVVIERMKTERNLRRALPNNEFELYYQPQLDLMTNKISGFEALIRWKSPELGFVSPAKFISIAEDTRLIISIGEWVLRNASLFLKQLHQMGYTNLKMSVNVSMLQLLQDDFVELVTDVLELAQIDPTYMELEITESILMESYEAIAGKLKLLRARGVNIALDDFGKGYSSLNYLRQLPITTLKIDKSFIDTISEEGKNKSLTDLIIKIGRSMELCVVAEGVETQEQMDYLVRHNCDIIQGYLFSKPLPKDEAIHQLRGEMTYED